VENSLNETKLKIRSSSNNLFAFSNMVDELECLIEQNKEFLININSIQQYHKAWSELEILNACALDDWEVNGKPSDFDKVWDAKYKQDAINLIEDLVKLLK